MMDHDDTVELESALLTGEAEDGEVGTIGAEGPSSDIRLTIPEALPILPIRESVAFPGTIMPLAVGREKSQRLLDAALSGNKIVGMVAQRFGEIEDPSLDDLYRVGTAGLILKVMRMGDGTRSIVVHGLARFGIESIVSTDPFMVAKVNVHTDHVAPSIRLDALVHNCRHLASRVIELSPNVGEEAQAVLTSITNPAGVSDFLAANLSLDVTGKQELLETFDIEERLEKVQKALASQLEVLELSSKLRDQVQAQIDHSQRRYYLQEQLKAIQKELGQDGGASPEIEALRDKIAQAKMPDAVEREAQRELDRMEAIPNASPEYSVVHDYLDWLCRVPWAVATEDKLDIARAERILNKDHHGLEKVKQRILEFLAVRKLKPKGRGPILCFVGPPGVGKTSLGQSIASTLGRKFIRQSLGGVHDEADIRGHRRTYIGAMPGRIVQEIVKSGSNNPVFMLDEVDKIGADFRGDPASALLEVLDPAQNHSFVDHYLDVPFDLSNVMFIATANYTDPIAPALYDRMEVIEISGYTERDKLAIAKRYLVPRQLVEHGLTKSMLEFDPGALGKIITGYTREAGVRNIDRQIAAVCRGVAARVARGHARKVRVTARTVGKYLGPEQFEAETAARTSVAGVATGLAFTPAGGVILFVESTRMPGRGQLTLTGQIGDVMRESAQAAFSLLRSRAKRWKIDPKLLADNDVHIHVPAGAVPKDGPSAGVTMLTSLVSLFTERPVCRDVAMTGELTLRGLVLPIGGVKEKVLAAQAAGLKTVILPAGNKKDLHDIPAETRKAMRFVFARKVDDVLRTALSVCDDLQPVSKRPRNSSRSARSRPA